MLSLVALGQVLGFGYRTPARLRLRKREVDRLLLGRDLELFHALQLFDSALHLLGFGSLVTEAIDKRLELFDLILLVAVGRLQLLLALPLLRQVLLVVAGVEP